MRLPYITKAFYDAVLKPESKDGHISIGSPELTWDRCAQIAKERGLQPITHEVIAVALRQLSAAGWIARVNQVSLLNAAAEQAPVTFKVL